MEREWPCKSKILPDQKNNVRLDFVQMNSRFWNLKTIKPLPLPPKKAQQIDILLILARFLVWPIPGHLASPIMIGSAVSRSGLNGISLEMGVLPTGIDPKPKHRMTTSVRRIGVIFSKIGSSVSLIACIREAPGIFIKKRCASKENLKWSPLIGSEESTFKL